MTRSIIVLFKRAFPQPFPDVWRLAWRAKLSRWMVWLVGTLLAVIPFVHVSAWADGLELPKILFGITIMSVWTVFGLVRSFLLPMEVTRLPRSSVWIAALAVLATIAVFISAHPAISFLGNSWQIGSSALVAGFALWLIVAIWDGVRHVPLVERFFVRSWLWGALGVSLIGLGIRFFQPQLSAATVRTFSFGNPFDLAVLSPLILIAGLYLLHQTPLVNHVIDRTNLRIHRVSHLILALSLCGLFGMLTLLDLGPVWVATLVVSIIAAGVMIRYARKTSLAIVVSLFVSVCSIISVVSWFDGMPAAWMNAPRQKLGFSSISEVLPTHALTRQIVKDSLEQKPLLGVGPGGWIYAFDQVRPLSFNQTPLWNARFPRAASAIMTWIVEYGLIASLAAVAFVFATLKVIGQTFRRKTHPSIVWIGAFCAVAIVSTTFRSFGVTQVMTLALGLGLVWATLPSDKDWRIPVGLIRQSRIWLSVIALLVVSVGFGYAIRRGASAMLLMSPTLPTTLFAVRLNPADDLTPDELARGYLELASTQFSADPSTALVTLKQGEDWLKMALTRNPLDADHWALAIRFAQARANVATAAEQDLLVAAQQLNVRRPTDPFAPLALFSVYRAEAARETRWVEQGQGLEKEQAIERLALAQTKATQALEEALRRKPDYAPALYAQAAWFAQLGKTNEAVAQLKRLATQSPNTPDIALPLALLYREAKQPDQAIAVLIPLIERFPSVLDYQWQLVLTTVQAGYLDQSIVILQRLMAIDPQNEQYQELLKEVIQQRAKQTAPAIVQTPAPVATSTPAVKPSSKKR